MSITTGGWHGPTPYFCWYKELKTAIYHLPGLFEHYEFYRRFLPLYRDHRNWFYDWCAIGSLYGAPSDCLWAGGRIEVSETKPEEVLALTREYDISARLTFSNSLLREDHLSDQQCNALCRAFESPENGIIITSDLLLEYIKKNYPGFYFVSSTTKVLTHFEDFRNELDNSDFRYVVPDFRFNRACKKLESLSEGEKSKVEFLCNECCRPGCTDRKRCYESVCRKGLGVDDHFQCTATDAEQGYRFSLAMKNPEFISTDAIKNVYLPMGFSNFKIEGRSLGSALILEFLLYYMTKPEYQLQVREELYLDNMLDLF